MQTLLILLSAFTAVYTKLTCTRCPFHISPQGHTNCTETCEGDVCHIVVNRFFNGTIIAGCINLWDGDTFKEAPASCYRSEYKTSCACNNKDRCNDPTSPIANFKFVDKPILEGYQLTPLVGGGRPPSKNDNSNESTGTTGSGVKSNEEDYAPSPNGIPIDSVATTDTVVTQTTHTVGTSTTPTTTIMRKTGVFSTRTLPVDLVVTKTVALQIADLGIPKRNNTVFIPYTRDEETHQQPKAEAHSGGESSSSSLHTNLSLAVFLTSLAGFISWLVF